MRTPAAARIVIVGLLGALGCEGDPAPVAAKPDAQQGADGSIDDAAGSDAGADDAAANDGSSSDTGSADAVTPDAEADVASGSDAATDALNPAAWQVCKAPADCVAVEIGCCDHCNGGEAWPVHKDYADAATKFWRPPTCEGTYCTEKACMPNQTTCQDGQCVLLEPSGCQKVDAAMLCVRGKPGPNGEETIAEGDPVQIQVFPSGCWSSSCTQVTEAVCQIQPGDFTTFVAASFCLKDTSTQGGGCTADCNGGSFASCEAGQWWNGTWPVAMNGLQLEVTVPSTLPPGGKCAGSPW